MCFLIWIYKSHISLPEAVPSEFYIATDGPGEGYCRATTYIAAPVQMARTACMGMLEAR